MSQCRGGRQAHVPATKPVIPPLPLKPVIEPVIKAVIETVIKAVIEPVIKAVIKPMIP